MTSWLVIPKHHDGRLQIDNAQVIEAANAASAATHLYMNAVVLGPVSDFSPDSMPPDKTNARPA